MDYVDDFDVSEVGDRVVLDPEQILEAAKGKYLKLVLIGKTDDGSIQVCGSHGVAESALLSAWATQYLVNTATLLP